MKIIYINPYAAVEYREDRFGLERWNVVQRRWEPLDRDYATLHEAKDEAQELNREAGMVEFLREE